MAEDTRGLPEGATYCAVNDPSGTAGEGTGAPAGRAGIPDRL